MSHIRDFCRVRLFSCFMSLVLVLTSIPMMNEVSAQTGSTFNLTAVSRGCDETSVYFYFDASGSFTSFTVSISNTSDNYSAVYSLPSSDFDRAMADSRWGFEHVQHRLDKVVLDVTMTDGSAYRYQADVTSCDVDITPTGGLVTDVPPVETPTETATETMVPTETATETIVPTETVVPTEVPVPTAVPAEPVPSDMPPAPTPITISFEVPDPTGGIWHTSEPDPDVVPMVSSSSRPGDVVIVNIAAPNEAEDWVLFTIPDPEDGAPHFANDRELEAFKVFLSVAPTVGNLYYTKPAGPFPTIVIIKSAPILIEQKDEPTLDRANMSLGGLYTSEDDSEGILVAQKVMVIVAVVTVGIVSGGVIAASVANVNKVPAGIVFLGGLASQGPAGYQPIFHFFAAPGEEWYLPPLPPGTYLLRLEAPDGEVSQDPFTLTGDPTESLLFRPNFDGEWELTVVHNGTGVTSLPSTGGGPTNQLPILILGLGVSAIGAAALAVRKVTWNRG